MHEIRFIPSEVELYLIWLGVLMRYWLKHILIYLLAKKTRRPIDWIIWNDIRTYRNNWIQPTTATTKSKVVKNTNWASFIAFIRSSFWEDLIRMFGGTNTWSLAQKDNKLNKAFVRNYSKPYWYNMEMETFWMKISMKEDEKMPQNDTIKVALYIGKRYFVRRAFLSCFTRSWYFSHADNLSFCHIGC